MQILDARRDQQQIIANLLQLYMYEFSPDQGTDVGPDGRFEWNGLADYWSNEGLHPFLLTADDKLAGFALVQRMVAGDGTLVWDVEDFFVMAKYRRSGLGAFAADHLFRLFTGLWQIRVLASNERALSFWRSTTSKYVTKATSPVHVGVEGRAFKVFRFST